VNDRFEELLKELGDALGVPLHPDKRRVCKLHINQELHVQIECDLAKGEVLLGCFACEIPPGKYRENILKEALKANHHFPRTAVLAYSAKNNQLALFHTLSLHQLSGKTLADQLERFVEMAHAWKISIEQGGAAPSFQPHSKGKP
jgi:hypothetical protein